MKKRSLHFPYFLLAMFMTLNATAQQQDFYSFNGKLVNSEGEAVPYASIFVLGTSLGVASNEQGQFAFPVPVKFMNDTIVVRALGYETYRVPVKDIADAVSRTFTLKEKVVVLKEVVVTAPDPEKELQIALDQWDEHFPTSKYEFRSFYRSTQKENGTYARLLEYALRGVDNGYNDEGRGSVGLEYLQERSSKDFRDPRTQWLTAFFKPQFIFTIENQSRKGKELKKNVRKGVYDIELDSNVLFDDEPVYVISAKAKADVHEFVFDARFYIRKKDHAFIRMDFDGKNKLAYLHPSGIAGNLKLNVNAYRSTYVFKEWEGKMYMYYLNVYAVYDWTGDGTHISQEENSEAIVQDIHPVNKSDIKSYNKHAAYVPKTSYDPSFWKNYVLIDQIPYDPQVLKDLQKSIPLEEQFRGTEN